MKKQKVTLREEHPYRLEVNLALGDKFIYLMMDKDVARTGKSLMATAFHESDGVWTIHTDRGNNKIQTISSEGDAKNDAMDALWKLRHNKELH